MLKVEGLTVTRKRKVICHAVSLTVAPGEATALVAPNGTGKTSLLAAIGGVGTHTQGHISADGADKATDFVVYRKRVFYLSDAGGALHPDLTVGEMLESARRIWGSDENLADIARRCGIDGYSSMRCSDLSQGMAQQVSFAAAWASGARYLLLDEPTNGLDQENRNRFFDLLAHLIDLGRGVVVSSHILGDLDRMCESVLFMVDGHLVEADVDGSDGGCAEMYRNLYQKRVAAG